MAARHAAAGEPIIRIIAVFDELHSINAAVLIARHGRSALPTAHQSHFDPNAIAFFE